MKPQMVSIVGDCWLGAANQEWRVGPASASDLEEALERLDAAKYTLLSIQLDGGAHLAIGGGNDRYIVYGTFDNEVFWTLLTPNAAEGIVMLVAGGQLGDYPAAHVVSRAQAIAAGRTFLEKGELDSSQQWQKT